MSDHAGDVARAALDETPPLCPKPGRLESVVEWGLAVSRALVIIPVVVSVLSALGAFAYGTYIFGDSVHRVISHALPIGNKVALFLIVIDLFLIGATLLIAGIGFYELFISRVDARGSHRMPGWLEMHDLNDLKARVIAMVVLVIAISFVEAVVEVNPGGQGILELGAGAALVIGALTAFLRLSGQGRG